MLEEIEDSADIPGTINEQEVIPEISLAEDKAVPEDVLTSTPPKIDVAAQAAITHLKTIQEKVISKADNKIIKQTEDEEIFEDVIIDSYEIKLSIPRHIIEQGASSNHESANTLAGYWAAQIIKNNKHLTTSSKIDPVTVWNDIKNVILKKMKYAVER